MNNAAENRERKILVVDDDPAVRRIVIEALKNQDYQVYDVGSGKDALEAVDKIEPHLVLLDVNMPGTSGLDVCRELRKQGVTTPIIMLTTEGQEAKKQEVQGRPSLAAKKIWLKKARS
jgi:DNA-binding response OmpR family regulator